MSHALPKQQLDKPLEGDEPMSYTRVRTILVGLTALNLAIPAFAFHGGGGGGGHGGGGGGFHGGGGGGFAGGGGYRGGGGFAGGAYGGYRGGYAAPSFNRTPSFSMPQSSPHVQYGNVNRSNSVNTMNRGNQFNSVNNGNRFNSVNNVNRVNTVNNVNNVNANRMGAGWNNPYMGYHQGWVHGYWNGNYAGGWGWRPYGYGYGGFGYGLGGGLGFGLGMGLGWGLSSWMYGPMLNNWGYSNYSNPYYGGGGYGNSVVAQQPIGYDYSQPIDSQSQPPDQAVASQATTTFDSAREAFNAGDYAKALNLTDEAIKSMPNDAALHEFRGLCLFALKRYDEAAASLYAVLSAGPGWDWTTLIGLYADPETYTQQLRALEGYCSQNPQSAAGRFVLGYHYLTEGHADAAVQQFKIVATLQPKDKLASQLIQQLVQSPTPASGSETAQAQTPPPLETTLLAPSAASTGVEGKLVGSWTAQPTPDTTITLSFQDQGRFTWKVSRQGKYQQFAGNSNSANGLLTLVQDRNNNSLVGRVSWTDETHFTFKVVGAGADDPGLSFTKSS
jgi:tetratricopeptide (TPR) repeat protein